MRVHNIAMNLGRVAVWPAAALAVVALLGWGLYAALTPARVPLQGQIEAQEIHVSSKVPGRVGKVWVHAGQRVKAGEVLFELDSPEVKAKVSQAKSAATAAQAVSDKAQAGARPQEVEMARANHERAQTGARLAQLTYERVEAMYQEGVIARQKRDEAKAQSDAATALAKAALAQYEMAHLGARSEDKRAALAQAQQVEAVVQEAEVAQAETRIVAPTAGEVAKVQIQAGELAPQGFPVVTLVKLQDAWAILQLRETELAAYTVGSSHRGQVVALGQAVDFKVESLAVLPDFATWKAARPGGTDVRTFEIRLRPAAPVEGLRPGMSVVFPAAR